jgi:hypothetical protein
MVKHPSSTLRVLRAGAPQAGAPRAAAGPQAPAALRAAAALGDLREPPPYFFASGIEIMPSQVFETFASRASSSENQCAVTLFSSVKNRTASVPMV